MAKVIHTEILIQATSDKVWEVLTKFDDYPSWNPFIKSVKGHVAVGEEIVIRIEPPEAKGMTFKPRVLAFEEGKELRWLGRLLFRGLFDGEHRFELIDNGNGTTTFLHSEKFKGILVPFFAKQLDNSTKSGFEEMNKALKALVERK